MLGATFHLHGLSPRQLVDFHLNKIWLGPFPFPILFDTLFLVDNRIMKNARELHLVRLGRVSVENHRAVGQPFLAQRPPQSCFVMGPGPGDRVAVNVGLSRASTSVWGFPLWTNPHHCSQSMERSAFTSCSQAASDKTSLLSKVASSPSTSDHFPEAPNLMPFSFCTTYFFRTSCRFLCMASTTLWFTPKMRWMEASGTRRITRSNKADWVWSDKASGPLPAWKSGCKYWGWILCWQALLLHRYFGLASLQWVCNVDKVPRLHLGQRLPDQSGKILSWISIFTMSMSEAFRSSGTTRRQWACSLRTPRTGTSCRKALFSSASKSDLGLSSAWLLLVATFNTTNAWLSFKVTRPCTGIDILSCMLTGGRVAMLWAESYKLWSEGGDASLWQRLTISLKCKSSSDLRSKIED